MTEFTTKHGLVHFKWANCIVCELHCDKAGYVKINEKKEGCKDYACWWPNVHNIARYVYLSCFKS